jgi:predicted ATPase
MAEFPTGTVTFLFTDIEGSTRLTRDLGERYPDVLADHRRALRGIFAAHGGVEVDTQGDAFFVAFGSAREALAAAAESQEALAEGPLRVRIGIHTGEATVSEEGYVGLDVVRGARIAAAAHGGQVVLSDATRALAGDEVSLRDLGEHRLKDLVEPTRLYQLGNGEFPPLTSLNWTNLPTQPTRLIGRERELREAGSLLHGHRLVTVTGPGGSGKTRLALQLAADAVGDFEHGVFWVPLQSLSDAGLVEPAIATAVGAPGEAVTHLRSRRTLLLLDNFEHLIEAAATVSSLLTEASQVKVLVTSREPLHLTGEREYPVFPLPDEDAVALFVERARAVRPAFEPDAVVPHICRRLDGLPLAIELAAARVKTLPPAALLERLERRLPLLTGGPVDAPLRQRTLTATLYWSYDLLESREEELFARLGVFAGGCTLEAAEAVCEADLDTLQSLVDKNLVRAAEGRFGMLETIREFALDRLAARGRLDEIRRRHAEHYLAVAQAADLDAARPDQIEWLARLEREHDNLNAALTFAQEEGQWSLYQDLLGALGAFWSLQGHWYEGRTWLDTGLRLDERLLPKLKLRMLGHAASIAQRQGRLDRARSFAKERLALAREVGDPAGLVGALMQLGVVALSEENYAEGTQYVSEALREAERLGDDFNVARAKLNLGWAAAFTGNYDRAEELFVEALRLVRALNTKVTTTVCLISLAHVRRKRGELATAVDALKEALQDVKNAGPERVVDCLIEVAGILSAVGDPESAARFLAAADAIGQSVGLGALPAPERIRREIAAALDRRADGTELEAAAAEGSRLTVEDAVDAALEALDGLDARLGRSPPAASSWDESPE